MPQVASTGDSHFNLVSHCIHKEILANFLVISINKFTSIHGIGFKTADLIAGKLGIATDSMIRAQAGVRHVLQEISGDGHCAAPWETLVEESVKLLEITGSIIETAIQEEIQEENLVLEDIDGRQCLFLTPLQRVMVGAASCIKRILG